VRVASFAAAPRSEQVQRLRDAGVVTIVTVGAKRHAQKVADIGVSAVIAQGGEGGGHTGSVPTSLLLPEVVDVVGGRVPVVAAGGYFDGRGLVSALAYGASGIAMGTLLPVIGRFELGLDEFTFGILYGVFGTGAVVAAFTLPTVNRLLGPDRANIWAMGVSAAATLVAALAMTPLVVGAVVAINGACWITVIANNGASVQMILPNYMRARGMAVHQMVFFGAMVLGALLWGKIANFFDVRTALIGSVVMLVPLTVLAASIKLPGASVPRV